MVLRDKELSGIKLYSTDITLFVFLVGEKL